MALSLSRLQNEIVLFALIVLNDAKYSQNVTILWNKSSYQYHGAGCIAYRCSSCALFKYYL